MAWYRPDLYHRVLSYSGTYVNQLTSGRTTPKTPGGAWEFHRSIIPNSPKKPLRIWMHVGDKDLLNPNVMRDGMHDWVEANERMARCWPRRVTTTNSCFARAALRRRGEATDAADGGGVAVAGVWAVRRRLPAEGALENAEKVLKFIAAMRVMLNARCMNAVRRFVATVSRC